VSAAVTELLVRESDLAATLKLAFWRNLRGSRRHVSQLGTR